MRMRRIRDVVSPHLAILKSAALLVPRSYRSEWMAEWRSELWYVLQRCNLAGHPSWWKPEGLFFCLGAFRDAVWLRRNNCGPRLPQRLWMQSPSRCLLSLAALATVTGAFFFRLPGIADTLLRASQGRRELTLAQFPIIALALLILPAATSLTLGEYPDSPLSPTRARRLRRCLFLGFKFCLMLPIVFFGTFDLAPILSATGLQAHATLIGYVLAFRWALIDQRRRCPVCLRLLTNPALIGQSTQIFVEWYGTELLCIKGHGLLHVPEIQTSYSTQRWLDLGPSWSNLFL